MDLADVGGNMMHGAHIASIGGTWMALVYGFAGMRDYGGALVPAAPAGASGSALRFALAIPRHGGCASRPATTSPPTRLIEGEQLTILHDGEAITLTAAAPTAPARTRPRYRSPHRNSRPRRRRKRS